MTAMPVAFALPSLVAQKLELLNVSIMSMPSVSTMSMPRAHPGPLPQEREKPIPRWIESPINECSHAIQSCSLSPRERAGVRGNGPYEFYFLTSKSLTSTASIPAARIARIPKSVSS
jgi:hypothetical protein